MKHPEMLLSRFETASFSIETVPFAIDSGKSYRVNFRQSSVADSALKVKTVMIVFSETG